MVRTVDPQRYAARRAAVLDAAEELIPERGYDATTIHDVIARAGISKGAFYHYFDSKAALLGGLVGRRLDVWMSVVSELAGQGDPPSRLRAVARTIAVMKAGDQDLLIRALPTLYADGNAEYYVRLRREAVGKVLPVVTAIVRDGLARGDFTAGSGEGASRVVVSLLQECTDVTARHLLALVQGQDEGPALTRDAAAYVQALHDVLGAPPGSLDFLDAADLDGWIRSAARAAEHGSDGRED